MVGLSDAVAFFLRVLCSVLHLARFLQAAADLRCSAKPSCQRFEEDKAYKPKPQVLGDKRRFGDVGNLFILPKRNARSAQPTLPETRPCQAP